MKVYKKILHKLILPCSEITFLIEKKIDRPLSFVQQMQFTLHLILCKWCFMYNKKAEFIHRALHNLLIKHKDVTVFHIDKEMFTKKISEKLK